jgi:DNA repair protein RecO (recombination protein O)
LVRGGAGPRLRPVLQPGNSVSVTWRARLDEHLGHYVVEGVNLRAAGFLLVPHALYGLTHLCGLVRLLPERDPHPGFHEVMLHILATLDDPHVAGAEMARFELRILAELGFGLDLETCAATGATEELVYVSPKSGRAVSRAAGAPWHDRLLRLPEFLMVESAPAPDREELAQAFALTGYFLSHYVLEPRGVSLPQERTQFIAAIARGFGAARISA